MLKFPFLSGVTRNPRKRRSIRTEELEARTLLSTFYVNGVGGTNQNGSQESPFGSIRQGIEAALQNPGDDEVVLLPTAAGPYTTPVAIVPGYSEIQIQGYSVFNGNLTIRGGGDSPDDVVIDTSVGDGIYVDAPIAVTISNLTVNQSGRHGILYRSQQPLIVDNVIVTNHTNLTGIIVQGADITVRNTVLANNYQGIWGGIGTVAGTGAATPAPGTVRVENTVSRNNTANGAFMRDATGPVTFTNFSASQNAFHGLWVNASASLNVQGGAFTRNTLSGINVENTGVVSISGSTSSDNGRNGIVSTLNQSLSVDSVTLERNGTLDVGNHPGGGGLHVRPGSATTVSISNSVIRDNRNWGNAGGIEIWAPQTGYFANASISNTIVDNNATLTDGANGRGFGGGIAAIGNTNLTVTGSRIAGNGAYSGGGIFFANSNSIDNQFPTLTIADSIISNNRSTTEAGGVTQRGGQTKFQRTTIAQNTGAVGGFQATSFGGQISNTTISGNTGGTFGGASLTSRNPLSIVNTTVTENQGGTLGGIYSTGTSVQFLNSIVAQNRQVSSLGTVESDFAGSIRSLGRNILGEVDTVTITSDRVTGPGPHSTDIFGSVSSPANAMLGPLANNGGLTFTHALLPGSPAINGGTSTGTIAIPGIDQRGFARAGLTDIGAFENQAPVGIADTATTDEDTPVTINVLANDFERDGEALTLVAVQGAQGGAAVVNHDSTVLFTPDANFNGVASFSYVLRDAAGLETITQVLITVVPVNDAPVAQDDFIIIDEDTLAQIGVLANDSDVDGDTVSVDSVLQQPANGTVQINPNGTISYTPLANFHGADSFTYRISDGKGGFDEATVSIVVNSVNDAPVAVADSGTTTEDMAITLAVTTNDSDIDGDTVAVSRIVTAPANGAVAINSAGQLVYTPKVDFSGTDSFVYEISDGNGGTRTASVTITVISRQAQMTALKARVQQLQDTGVITSRQGRTLQGYLVFSKDPAQTVNSLTQFQAEVQRLINSQTLSSTIGLSLIADAERLKRSVSIFANTGGGGGGGKGPK